MEGNLLKFPPHQPVCILTLVWSGIQRKEVSFPVGRETSVWWWKWVCLGNRHTEPKVGAEQWFWAPRAGVKSKREIHWASQVALVVKNPPASAGRCRRCRFDPWFGKIHWRRAQQPTLVSLPGESHGMAMVQSITQSRTQLKWLSTHTGNRWNGQPHATPQRREKQGVLLFILNNEMLEIYYL